MSEFKCLREWLANDLNYYSKQKAIAIKSLSLTN